MLLKILLIALIVYVIVVTRVRVRLPHPGLQATVDVLQAATLRDEETKLKEQRDEAQPVRRVRRRAAAGSSRGRSVCRTARAADFALCGRERRAAEFPRLPDAAGQCVRDGRRQHTHLLGSDGPHERRRADGDRRP